MKWACGLTTTPRRLADLLPRTILSLTAAGFDTPRLFVDDATPADEVAFRAAFPDYVITFRPAPPLRTHGNWVLGLAELFVRSPLADRFAMIQDDVVFVQNLRSYLERIPFPDKGYLNLYTEPLNQPIVEHNGGGKTGFWPSNQRGRGALALVFDRWGVLSLLTSMHLAERPLDQHRGWRAIDGGVVDSIKKAGGREYCHQPSLCQHTGEWSSMDHRKHMRDHDPNFPPRRWNPSTFSTSFPGEDFDAMSFLADQPALMPDASVDWEREVAAITAAIAGDEVRLKEAVSEDQRRRLRGIIANYRVKLAEAKGNVLALAAAQQTAGA